MGPKRALNAIPLGVLLTIIIGAASVGPEDAQSNLSKWAHPLGSKDLPSWLIARSADYKTIAVAVALSVAYGAIVWGLPWLRSLGDKIPIEEAARIAYEAAEHAGALDLVESPNLAAPYKLDHFKFAMMIDRQIRLYGVKPPSTKLLPIATEEYPDLYPVTGLNQLNYLHPYQNVAYIDVRIGRGDLQRLIRQYVPRVQHFRRRFNLVPKAD